MRLLPPKVTSEWSRSLACIGAATALATILAFLLLVPGGPYSGTADHPAVRSVTSWTGVGMAVFGLAWLVRIYHRDPEAGPSRWRLYSAREWTRSLFYLGTATALLSVLAFVYFAPGGASMYPTSWTGLAMAVFGLAWLMRIYRRDRDPEAGPSPWRFHQWD